MFTNILIDIETGTVVTNAEIITPLVNRLFAPFLDFPNYFLTLPRPETQLISWLSWLCAIWIVFALLRPPRVPASKKILPVLRGVLVIIVFFILFIAYCILCPLPQYRITSGEPDEIFLDLHSHTIHSHDGIVTPGRNLRWHLNSGFSGWAITEHDRVGPAAALQRQIIEKTSLPATAIPAQEVNFRRAHLNLLGIKESIDANEYKNLSDLIKDVHRMGGAVIAPHYWAETRSPFSMKDLADAGVDAFEIAGNASIPLTHAKRREIIALCRNEGRVPLSGTNWHGWRNFCTVWTGFNSPGWKEMDAEGRERAVIEALRNRESDRFRVIGYKQRSCDSSNDILEPPAGIFLYFTSIDMFQQASWLFWIAVICFAGRRMKNRRIAAIILWTVITLLLVAGAILIFNIWNAVSNVNKILPDLGKVLIALAIFTSFLAATNLLNKKRKLCSKDKERDIIVD